MRLHHLAPESGAQGSASDVPGGVAAAQQTCRVKPLCQSPSESGGKPLKRSANAYFHWCRRHPGWHLPINELWHRAKQAITRAPGEGTLVVCMVALATKVLPVSCVSGYARPRHPMRTATSLASDGAWPLVCPMAAVAKQPLGAHCPRRCRAWLSAAGADGFIVLPRLPAPVPRHVHDGAVSSNYVPIPAKAFACSMGGRRLRSVATPVICKACSIHCKGMLL